MRGQIPFQDGGQLGMVGPSPVVRAEKDLRSGFTRSAQGREQMTGKGRRRIASRDLPREPFQ